MAKKSNKSEVKHVFLNETLENLNKIVGEYTDAGFRLLDAKVLNTDFYNKTFVVFYIFIKDKLEEENG